MPRGPIVYAPPPGTVPQQPNTVIQSAMFNAFVDDVTQAFNTPTPVVYGGTGVSTITDARLALGITWERISVQTATSVTQVAWVDLSPFRQLRLHADFIATGNTGGILVRTSTNNGSSYDGGATDYTYHGETEEGGNRVGVALVDSNSFPVSGVVLGANVSTADVDISGFNSINLGVIEAKSLVFNSIGGGHVYSNLRGFRKPAASPRNALLIGLNGGTMTGQFILEGIRG